MGIEQGMHFLRESKFVRNAVRTVEIVATAAALSGFWGDDNFELPNKSEGNLSGGSHWAETMGGGGEPSQNQDVEDENIPMVAA